MALIVLKLRKIRAQIAAMRKSSCLCQQRETFQTWQRAAKHAITYARSRDKEANAALMDICARDAIDKSTLEKEYTNFFWHTEKLKELQKNASDQAAVYAQAVESTSQARREHIRCESKLDQAILFYKKVLFFNLQKLLRLEAEENEEVANNRHILKSLKSNFYDYE